MEGSKSGKPVMLTHLLSRYLFAYPSLPGVTAPRELTSRLGKARSVPLVGSFLLVEGGQAERPRSLVLAELA